MVLPAGVEPALFRIRSSVPYPSRREEQKMVGVGELESPVFVYQFPKLVASPLADTPINFYGGHSRSRTAHSPSSAERPNRMILVATNL